MVIEGNSDDLRNGPKLTKLKILLAESPDGTILVSADGKWPNVRIPVQSLVDCNVTYADEIFKMGSIIYVKEACFRRIPKSLPTIQAPSYHYRVKENSESPQELSGRTYKTQTKGIDEKSGLKSRSSRRIYSSSSSNECLSSIQAPVLQNLSYVGKRSLKIGDKMTWVYSIKQGSIPLAWTTLTFSTSVSSSQSTISHNFSVPWDFDPDESVTRGSFTVKISANVMSGVYTLNQVSLTTQSCPFSISSTYWQGGAVYNSANAVIGVAVLGPTSHQLSLLSSSSEPFVLSGGISTCPVPPQLIQLRYIGNISVSYGQDLKWEYKVSAVLNASVKHLACSLEFTNFS